MRTGIVVTALLSMLMSSSCRLQSTDGQSALVLPDSLVGYGILLQNRGDTSFRLKPHWHVADSILQHLDGNRWVVDQERHSGRRQFSSYDSSIISINGDWLRPKSVGKSQLVVEHAGVYDTIGVVVGLVGPRLVATLDSNSLPRRPAYHDNTWDTIGGWFRNAQAGNIGAGIKRSVVMMRLGWPRATCLSSSDQTLTDSWAIDRVRSLVVQYRGDTVVSTYIADHETMEITLTGELSE